jgi:hypothetical protein
MAAGDIYQLGPSSVAASAFLSLQPAGSAAVVIHNIYYSGAVELYYFTGANSILFDSDATAGARLNLTHHCSNGVYVRVKNVSSGAILVAADGIFTA